MDIFAATRDFERWLGSTVPIVRRDVALKHALMAEDSFSFFRATFYRAIERWLEICGDLAKAPRLLAVCDAHVENFGTWRDREGRLIWGVNDVDEVWPAAYTLDLVRLTTSAYLAIQQEHLGLTRAEAAEAIEAGYREGLGAGGRPFVLAEDHRWLRLLALSKLRDPVRFWKRMRLNPPCRADQAAGARALIAAALPARRAYQLKRRVAGLGSLGQPRIVGLASWQGGLVAREAKAVRPSAWAWYRHLARAGLFGPRLVARAVRVEDPEMHFHGRWLVRRLAPDCSRIELTALPAARDERRLLYCMGWEVANLHLATPRAIAAVKRDLARRDGRWLHKAAKAMAKACLEDWEDWRAGWRKARGRIA